MKFIFFSIPKYQLDEFFYRQIKKICNRGDRPMDNIRLHDFRHSHVAYIIDKGEEPVLIKEPTRTCFNNYHNRHIWACIHK